VPRNPKVLLRTFNVNFKPLLDYATCVWLPHYNNAIDKTEAVQRKFAKMLKGSTYMDYHARLNYLQLYSLERRLSVDLVIKEFLDVSVKDSS